MNIFPQKNIKSEQAHHYNSMLLITVILCFSGAVITGYLLLTLITLADYNTVLYNINSIVFISFLSISILLGIFALPIVYKDYNDIVFSSTVNIGITIPISTVVNYGPLLSLTAFFLSVTLSIMVTN